MKRSLLIFFATLLILASPAASHAQGDICWKDSYGRGAGTIPAQCPAGTERDGLLCYPACRAGYSGVGPVCWQNCPSNFTDTGGHCLKPSSYGRGAGYPWKFGDGLNDSGMFQRCEGDNGRGNCEKSGAIVYPRCKPGFHAVGCCVCSPDCPPGTTDIGVSCQKSSYGRGAGAVGSCGPGLVNDAGLCYERCRQGTAGVGPVCWAGCNSDYPVNCGGSCAVSESACAFSIIKQVQSTGELTLNVAMLASTGGAGNAALKAAQTTARTTGKTVLSVAARQAAKDTFKSQLKRSVARRRIENAEDVLNNTASLEALAEAAVNAKENGEFDWETVFSMEDLDPTGVLAVVNSFNRPICGTPRARAALTQNASPLPPVQLPVQVAQAVPQQVPQQQQWQQPSVQQPPVYAQNEGVSCESLVQGRIAWDYSGNRAWAPGNLQRLCGGASDPTQPPRCFERAMHGGINWGGGTQWQWGNAIALCQGTNNADATISCFQAQISQGNPWQNAIRGCRGAGAAAPAPVPAQAPVPVQAPQQYQPAIQQPAAQPQNAGVSCESLVQGRIAWDYSGNRAWAPGNLQRLCSGASDPTQPPRCFERAMHGGINWGGGTQWQWGNAIALCQGTNNADATISCFQAQISQGNPWQNAIRNCRGAGAAAPVPAQAPPVQAPAAVQATPSQYVPYQPPARPPQRPQYSSPPPRPAPPAPRAEPDIAAQYGRLDGLEKGRSDARQRKSFDLNRHDAYKDADHGYNSGYGSKDTYRGRYRPAFEQGYREGFGQGR